MKEEVMRDIVFRSHRQVCGVVYPQEISEGEYEIGVMIVKKTIQKLRRIGIED